MIEELKQKLKIVLTRQGYDPQSISVINATLSGTKGLQCSGTKRKWVEDPNFDLSQSITELQIALLPHISSIESKYNVKLKIIFQAGLVTSHQFFIGPDKI